MKQEGEWMRFLGVGQVEGDFTTEDTEDTEEEERRKNRKTHKN